MPNKVGRPTKYNLGKIDLMMPLFKEGASILEICAELDIHPDTFYEWKEKYPEFSEAIRIGESLSEAWWIKMGRSNIYTDPKRPFNVALWKSNMANKFQWSDRVEAKQDTTVTFKVDYED